MNIYLCVTVTKIAARSEILFYNGQFCAKTGMLNYGCVLSYKNIYYIVLIIYMLKYICVSL